ncbi:hypothetical protein O3G_MSEX003401 [Manduca sexta]|uniref:Uncharacterized protein n=1 Tax=Manduca sexta TaxID=7130 RepID=A0A922CGC1_MANSE|nr:hypothetical protein O3G_MSEX003401 [Manduca sexta]
MGLIAAIIVQLFGGAAIYLTGGLLLPLLGPLLGFSSSGIVAGSLAAGAQSYYGNLAAGSIISLLTSAAMVSPTPVSLCTVCAMLTCCLMLTIITVMVMGVGIGYHYCFVQSSVDAMAKAAKSAGALRSRPEPGHVMRSVDRAVKRGFAHRVSRRGVDGMLLTNNNTDIFVNQNDTGGNKTNFTNY